MSVPTYRLFDLAAATLDAIVDRWPADHTPLPVRQYINIGNPAADDEQLVVWIPRTLGTPNGNVGQQGIQGYPNADTGMRTVVLTAQLLRTVPTVNSEGTEIVLPTAAELTAAAKMLLGDAQAILNCVLEAQDDKVLAGFGNLAFETWDAIDPTGGLSGGQQRIRLGTW